MKDFKECVENIAIADINKVGLHYTWNQRPNACSGILKKLDCIMSNEAFTCLFKDAYADFQPYGISDHSPSIMKISIENQKKPHPFKFANFVDHKKEISEVVKAGWNQVWAGHRMFQVVTKLKALKKPFRKLMWKQGDIHERVKSLGKELEEVLRALDGDPNNQELRLEEHVYLKSFLDAKLDEERFLKQISKVQWLRENNTSYFHKVVRGKRNHSRIHEVRNGADEIMRGEEVSGVFVKHYENFLGKADCVKSIREPESLFT